MQFELNSSFVLSYNDLICSTDLVWPSKIDTIGHSMLRTLIHMSLKMRIEARLHGVIVISSDEDELDEDEEEECDDGEEIGGDSEDAYDPDDPFIDDTSQDYPDEKPKRKLYEHLELDMDCSKDLMKKKYREMSKFWHPDKNSSQDALIKMQLITQAYRVLSDDKERRKYGE